MKHSLNSDRLPSSLGRVPVNELPAKSKDAAQKKGMDKKAKNEIHTETVNLFVLLDVERQARFLQLVKPSLNSDKLPSSLGRIPVNELLDESKNAAQETEMDMTYRQSMRGAGTQWSC